MSRSSRVSRVLAVTLLCTFVLLLPTFSPARCADSPGDAAPAALGEKGYLPKTLEECFVQLKLELGNAGVEKFKNLAQDALVHYQTGLGAKIRKDWELHKPGPLVKFFNDLGITHPEDMTGMIFTSYWRQLNDVPLQLDQQAEYYKRYWARMMSADARERLRAQSVGEKIRLMMLNLAYEHGSESVLKLPALEGDLLPIRYAALFGKKVILTGKTSSDRLNDNLKTPAYLVDLESDRLRPIEANGLDTVDDALVLNGILYLHGQLNQKEKILSFADDAQAGNEVEVPPGYGWFRLASGPHLLAIRPHSVFEYKDGSWEKLCQSKDPLPRTAIPPQRLGDRIYFRQEDDERELFWLDLTDPSGLFSFVKNIGLIGVEGPRWETVNSFACLDARLWICCGGPFVQSLLTWTPSAGYAVVTMNDRLRFDGKDLLSGGKAVIDGIPPDDIVISAVAPQGKDESVAVGSSGLYEVSLASPPRLRTLAKFKNTEQDTTAGHITWRPSQVVKVGQDDFVFGSPVGGAFRLCKDKSGRLKLNRLDGRLGKPIRL